MYQMLKFIFDVQDLLDSAAGSGQTPKLKVNNEIASVFLAQTFAKADCTQGSTFSFIFSYSRAYVLRARRTQL